MIPLSAIVSLNYERGPAIVPHFNGFPATQITGYGAPGYSSGDAIIDSAVEAGELRLRPILMTSLAFIFGVLPLFLAVGAGANARHSIGTGIIGGMIGASTLALLYVPFFFYILDRFAEKFLKKEKEVIENENDVST